MRVLDDTEYSQYMCNVFWLHKLKQHCDYYNDFNVLFIWPLRFLRAVSLD